TLVLFSGWGARRLWRPDPVKAVGSDATLGVIEMHSASERVGPHGQPAHEIGRYFKDHQPRRWPSEIETKLAAVETEIGSGGSNGKCRVAFTNRVVTPVRH